MKKPKRTLTNGELSQIIMKVCLFLGAICMIPIIVEADSLSLKFKIVDIIMLMAIIIGVIVDFVFKYIWSSQINEEKNKETEIASDEEGEEKK